MPPFTYVIGGFFVEININSFDINHNMDYNGKRAICNSAIFIKNYYTWYSNIHKERSFEVYKVCDSFRLLIK